MAVDPSTSAHSASSTRKPRAVWDKARDTVLMEELLGCARDGMRINNGFKPTAWQKAVDSFNVRFQAKYDKLQMKTRYAAIKASWLIWEQLCNNSGFGWDGALQVPTAPDHVWDAYLREHPEASPYRERTFPNLEIAQELFTGQTATGTFAKSSLMQPKVSSVPGSRATSARAMTELDREGTDDESEVSLCSPAPAMTPNASVHSGSRTPAKPPSASASAITPSASRKRVRGGGAAALASAMESLASAYKSTTDKPIMLEQALDALAELEEEGDITEKEMLT